MAKEKDDNAFPDKYAKKLQSCPGFTDGVNAANTDEIKAKILVSEGNIYEIEHEKDNNEIIHSLKEELKNLTAPFQEAKGIETAKIKYCFHTLTSRGIKI